MEANVGAIRALIPLYTVKPPLPIQHSHAQGDFDMREGRRDGIVYIGYESNRVKGEYLPSGKMIRRSSTLGSLIDMYI